MTLLKSIVLLWNLWSWHTCDATWEILFDPNTLEDHAYPDDSDFYLSRHSGITSGVCSFGPAMCSARMLVDPFTLLTMDQSGLQSGGMVRESNSQPLAWWITTCIIPVKWEAFNLAPELRKCLEHLYKPFIVSITHDNMELQQPKRHKLCYCEGVFKEIAVWRRLLQNAATFHRESIADPEYPCQSGFSHGPRDVCVRADANMAVLCCMYVWRYRDTQCSVLLKAFQH